MVSMGLKNSLKKQRVLKSPWKLKKIRISLKSPWIVLKAPWTKITLIIKEKVFCVIFFMMFLAWQFIFRYLKFSRNRAFMGEWYCNKQPPPPLPTDLKCLYFISFYVKLQEKQVLEKLILVLENSLIFPHKFCMKSFAVFVPQVRVNT